MAAQTCFKINNTKKTYLGPSPEPPPALDIEQLEIYAGQTTAVLGYSGSGKSTLLSLLGLLDTPDAGEIIYFSHAGDTYTIFSENGINGNCSLFFKSFVWIEKLQEKDKRSRGTKQWLK